MAYKVIQRVENVIRNYHYMFFYQRLARESKIQNPSSRFRPPSVGIRFTGIIGVFFAIMFAAYRQWNWLSEYYLWWFIHAIPDSFAHDFAYRLILWGVIHFYMVFFGIGKNMDDFQFLDLLNSLLSNNGQDVDPESRSIKTSHLHKWIFRLGAIWSINLILLGEFCMINVQIIRLKLWQRFGLWYAIFWDFLAQVYTYGISTTWYSMPIFICYVGHFLTIRQRKTVNKIRRLKRITDKMLTMSKWNKMIVYKKFIEINLELARFNMQVDHHRRTLKPYTTILIFGNIQLITYMIYLLFFKRMPYFFVIHCTDLLCLTSVYLLFLIGMTSPLAKINRTFGKIDQQILDSCFRNHSRFQKRHSLLKMESISFSLVQFPLGFTLCNDYQLTQRTYLEVIYSISLFFFLVFK